jgi:septum formation protein
MTRLILASTSAYRAELLSRLRLPFETVSPRVDERIPPGEAPAAAAARLALAKAEAVAGSVSPAAGERALVIGADQVPALHSRILRKPGTHADTVEQLAACVGRTVMFHTGVAVVDTRSGDTWQTVDVTEVELDALTRAQLERYVELERPYDCAGGFRAEGLGIVLFRAIRSDDPTGLIGLPLIWLAATLRRAGLDPLDESLDWDSAR